MKEYREVSEEKRTPRESGIWWKKELKKKKTEKQEMGIHVA